MTVEAAFGGVAEHVLLVPQHALNPAAIGAGVGKQRHASTASSDGSSKHTAASSSSPAGNIHIAQETLRDAHKAPPVEAVGALRPLLFPSTLCAEGEPPVPPLDTIETIVELGVLAGNRTRPIGVICKSKFSKN
ncbi:hypothetical protein E2C01_024544 [Portunus trituberculatus]|uniref:Uncharacterized protein n=1 Tax=Portunus trituberculatus TaxID=210409 RepID=A0A5B7ED43_PORTR|nr:hypothetical protein [Portunus trituberculatus]